MKVNVMLEHKGGGEGLLQQEFDDVGGVSLSPEDGTLILMDNELVEIVEFAADEWIAFAAGKAEDTGGAVIAPTAEKDPEIKP